MRLDFNENTVGCSPRVLERLKKITAEDLTVYPEYEMAHGQASPPTFRVASRPDDADEWDR